MRHATPRPCTISGKRDFPVSELKLFASARSAGKDIKTPFGEDSAMHRCHAQCMDAACAPLQRHDNSRARAAANNTRCTRHHALRARGGVQHPTPRGCACVGLLAHGVPPTPRCAGDKKIEEFTLESARACDVVFLAVAG